MVSEIPLAVMQQWMQAVIMAKGDDLEAIHSPEATKFLSPQQVEYFILPSRTLEPIERLHIYRRMYILRLCEALASDFEAFSDYVGKDKFEELVTDYVAIYPSTSYSLNPLSYRFPEFLRSRKDIEPKRFLVELAELELAITQVFDMPQSPLLSSEQVSAVPPEAWERVILRPIKALRLLKFDYPVNDYLTAFRNESVLPEIRRKNNYVLVYRPGYSMRRESLSRQAYLLLRHLLDGKPIALAIESCIGQGVSRKLLQEKLFYWFRDWVASGVFSSLECSARD
ncbi:MAG: DNA-binding domain-containing protein [Acidobacteriota bacterium]|nr:DNA-binding domain-containing protein [Blastocatellia bacterium]MDW8412477.1 DNA-binding domain-containing protein [Acidobacteriota bacterium]